LVKRLASAPIWGEHNGMTTLDPSEFGPLGTRPGGPKPQPFNVFFDRRELDLILALYGRMVAQGEWRDYAIDALKEAAVFSVFRRTSEMPLYRIEKRPDRKRQGAYGVVSATGHILKRGHELGAVLRVFDKKRLRIV